MSGNRKEVRAILPWTRLPAGETQIDLVDQRGRLESVTDPFALHVRAGHPAQLTIDERHEPVGRFLGHGRFRTHVPYVRAADPEDYVFSNVGRVIGYPFEIAGD